MLARVTGAILTGIEAILVEVECDLSPGLPTFTIVGLPDVSVQEARERVRAAINHSGEQYPMTRITVNLAPSDVRKQGPALDLAVAVAILVAHERVPAQGVEGRVFVGELGLSGDVRPIRGALASAEAARVGEVQEVVCPVQNAAEAALAGLPVLPVGALRDALAIVRGHPPDPVSADPRAVLEAANGVAVDIGQIRGQDRAKRGLEIAAAGGHNVLFTGPPGSGKTLLARALPGILPPMTVDEALEVTRIHSAAGLMRSGDAIVAARPFRAPHHGVSPAGLVGGGSAWARPGEISLSHRGVLFMDELPEFPRSCLEALRQPLEDGVVTVVRARHATTYPARFQLVAAMNPCPCGNRGSPLPCRCTPRTFEIYRQRLSGPLLDRIDLHVEVPRVEASNLLGETLGEPSLRVRARTQAARAAGAERGGALRATCNAELPQGSLLRTCAATGRAMHVLSRCADRMKLSARSVHRVLRVARTIADLAGRDRVEDDDVLEAVSYRVIEHEEDEP